MKLGMGIHAWRPALALASTLGIVGVLALGLTPRAISKPTAAGPRLAHMVFFTLKDHAPESRERFVASCHKYLGGHEGTSFFAVGTIAEDVVEPVSARDFDVALHLVFDNKEAEAKYLKDPRHVAFVEENKDTWSKVRVFDSYLAKP